MAQFQQHFAQDLTQDIKIRQCGTVVFNADNLSNVISVDLYNGQTPASLGGSVVGAVICPDGSTVPITNGTISGNTVSITLTRACFAIAGQIGVGIQIVSGETKTTVLKAVYNVIPFTTDNVIDPDSRVSLDVADLISDIDAAVATIPASYADLLAAVAPTFDTSTAYAAGAYVWYDGKLYRFTTDHAAGSWDSAQVTEDALSAGIADANDLIGDISVIPYAAKVTDIDLVPSVQTWFYRQGYIRHAGLSSPGQISANNNYRTYAFKARQDLQITGCDFPNADSNHWGCIRVSNEEPVTGTGHAWTGSLYDTKTANIPTSESPATVLKGQWVAVNYYRSGAAGDTWTLHIKETGARFLQQDIPLSAAMKAYVDARIAELQALILENN